MLDEHALGPLLTGERRAKTYHIAKEVLDEQTDCVAVSWLAQVAFCPAHARLAPLDKVPEGPPQTSLNVAGSLQKHVRK